MVDVGGDGSESREEHSGAMNGGANRSSSSGSSGSSGSNGTTASHSRSETPSSSPFAVKYLNVHGILITVVQTGSVGVWGWDKLLLSLVAGQVPYR